MVVVRVVIIVDSLFERRTFSGSEATIIAIAGLSTSGANLTFATGIGVMTSFPAAIPLSCDSLSSVLDSDSFDFCWICEFDRDLRNRSDVRGVRSQHVSGTQRYVRMNITATMMPTMMNTQRQPRDWITAAETRGTRFFPPIRSIV